MPDLTLRQNLSEPTFSLNIALRGVVDTDTTPAIVSELYWRWEDEPDMKPQPLGKVTAGQELAVPFDLQGRQIRISSVALTEKGDQDVSNLKSAVSKLFTPTEVAVLADATFDSGTDEVTLTIDNNGGAGNINIFRQIDSEGFFLLTSVAPATTSYVDSPEIDGTYQYKLTQDLLTGESNTKTVAVDVDAAGAGSPPSALTANYDDGLETTDLDWTNNGGTGDNVIERKEGFNPYTMIATVASSAITYTDSIERTSVSRSVYYRVRNTSVAGYSNVEVIYVPKL